VYFNKIKSNLGGLSCTRGPLSLWINDYSARS